MFLGFNSLCLIHRHPCSPMPFSGTVRDFLVVVWQVEPEIGCPPTVPTMNQSRTVLKLGHAVRSAPLWLTSDTSVTYAWAIPALYAVAAIAAGLTFPRLKAACFQDSSPR